MVPCVLRRPVDGIRGAGRPAKRRPPTATAVRPFPGRPPAKTRDANDGLAAAGPARRVATPHPEASGRRPGAFVAGVPGRGAVVPLRTTKVTLRRVTVSADSCSPIFSWASDDRRPRKKFPLFPYESGTVAGHVVVPAT